MKLDVLAIGAHPDDVELGCSGTLINEIRRGKKVGIVDLTQGELGTRGTIETRYSEAAEASMIMGVSVRENLKMRDGFFRNDEDHQMQVVKILRKYKPEIVKFAEDQARTLGYKIIMMHARNPVIKFYQKCGYEISGDEFFEVGMGHHQMQKTL